MIFDYSQILVRECDTKTKMQYIYIQTSSI